MKSWKKKQLRLSLFQVTREIIFLFFSILFIYLFIYLNLFIEAQIQPVHKKLAKKKTIVTFCEQNIVDLQ